MTWEEYGDTVQACRNTDRKAKTHLELNLSMNAKGNEKSLYRYTSSKRKTKKNVYPLRNRVGAGVEKDMERSEVVNAILAPAFSGMTILHES